ncbi:hypothetical protein [Frankia sp. AgB32]|uniref:hypothetical protein n=1 Tax=Frankia sp. AgB32 TaxID=631119 RepID=UPI00200EA289|nr:hypothetical protein [Frankia sp. AgB32]MCK9897740.1 hypothetical protein [Frankia sp. AgB32]
MATVSDPGPPVPWPAEVCDVTAAAVAGSDVPADDVPTDDVPADDVPTDDVPTDDEVTDDEVADDVVPAEIRAAPPPWQAVSASMSAPIEAAARGPRRTDI